MNAIIGRKLGMTQLFAEDGTVTPVTVIEAGPCPVVQVRSGDGATRVQLGFGAAKAKRASRAERGHAAKAGLEAAPKVLREFATSGEAPQPGAVVTVAAFAAGETVKVTGVSKGRGFQGVVKRYGFGGGPASHGNTRFRKPGSVGPGTDPSRVIKGKRMPGHMGARRTTQIGLTVAKVDAERNLLYVQGAVPGPVRGIVTVRKEAR
ncbi:MAG: 50S ribosomal protein L3 [Gemmatimonadetes bacterium GWC2_71_9]|nr:MAG: 50S ribosomal protein L3 [Gemmatimonadetes bacterium GWC2_71_9]OGT94995.1 MAG: 50S ribosomal protein L3 [Gemmatimonadetes bacterium RIFCSPLOWO2_02_FULL_71_11]